MNRLSFTEWILPEIISHYNSRMCCVYIIKPWNPLINVASISHATIGLSHKTTHSLCLSLSILCFRLQRLMRIFPLKIEMMHCYKSSGFTLGICVCVLCWICCINSFCYMTKMSDRIGKNTSCNNRECRTIIEINCCEFEQTMNV